MEALAFPGEDDFADKLATSKKERRDVEVVRLRNNVCHGNIFEFITPKTGEVDSFFTPDALRAVSAVLLGVSFERAVGRLERSATYGTFPRFRKEVKQAVLF